MLEEVGVLLVPIGGLSASKTDAATTLDSHANMCIARENALKTHCYECQVTFTGYDKRNSLVQAKKDSAAQSYTKPKKGEIVLLEIDQAIHICGLKHNLLCPMKMRMNDVRILKQPRFLTDNLDERVHAIAMRDEAAGENFILLLFCCG